MTPLCTKDAYKKYEFYLNTSKYSIKYSWDSNALLQMLFFYSVHL